MNKTELVKAIAIEADMSNAEAKRALDAFIKTTSFALKDGQRVALTGFGTFTVEKRASRKGSNPRTGAAITIPAMRVPKFKAGTDLKNLVR